MHRFESRFLDIKLQIPAGWDVLDWPDDGAKELANSLTTGEAVDSGGAAAGAIRPLLSAILPGPRSSLGIDALIALKCVTEDFFRSGAPKSLSDWTVNGIETTYSSSCSSREPESTYYRFARWEVMPGLYLYADIQATGMRRFEYALSVFETLAPIDHTPKPSPPPLYETPPWNETPSLYRITKPDDDRRPYHELIIDPPLSESELESNAKVLAGEAALDLWAAPQMRRKSRALVADYYKGPEGLPSCGVFSERFIELLGERLREFFDLVPCTINDKPNWFFVRKRDMQSCLDIEASQVRRFDDGKLWQVERYQFRNDSLVDLLVFAIPEERFSVFATASVPAEARNAKLKGLAFHPLDGNGRQFTCPG